MECNKEEAIRARSIAEKKMQCKDFVGALKFALKAQQLCPDIENISQMLTVCEVHCAAETKVNGSEDWYGILQVESTADELLINKQYRKFALLLHPDKNKFAGAEAAFKLVGEARRALSDKVTRSIYDMKRKANLPTMGRQRPPYQPNMSSTAGKQAMASNPQRNNVTVSLSQQQAQTAAQTFWTLCPTCGTKYQYYRNIINKALRCQTCMNPFIAYDLNAQGTRPTPPPMPNSMGMKNIFGEGLGNKGKERNQGDNETKQDQVKFEHASKNKPVVQPTRNSSSKRSRKVVEESSDTDSVDSERVSANESEDADSMGTDSADSEGNIIEESEHVASKNTDVQGERPRRSRRQKHNVSYNEDSSSDYDAENLTSSGQKKKSHKYDVKLSADSDKEVGERTWAADPKLSKRDKGASFGKDRGDEGPLRKKCKDFEDPEVKNEGSIPLGRGKPDGSEQRSANGLASDDSTGSENCNNLSYPDPEFHDFDEDRGQTCFSVDQIWALYDDADGMPRFYARIRSVSLKIFKVRFTWLEYLPVSQTENAWVDSDLPIGCGNYKHGKTENTEDIHLFSHKMLAKKGSKGSSYAIYPRVGEVWAIFKDWDIRWSSDPDRHRKYGYDFVEIVSDFTSDAGVSIRPLVKVKGFVSLFCIGRKTNCIIRIPPSELLRFSHLVPSYRMTGNEKKGIPKGSFELDPASLPSDFETTLESVSLDEVWIEEHMSNVNGTGSLRTRTMEKKSTNNEGDEKIRKNYSLRGANRSGDALKCGFERRNSQLSGNDIEDMESESGTHRSACEENGYGSPSCPSGSMASQFSGSESYDFHLERSKEKFQAGQVWALYCEHDGFPKYYALVKKVTSEKFEVHIRWLEAYAQSKQEEVWMSHDLPFASGRFLPSDEKTDKIYDTVDYFSHMVQAKQVEKGQYDIYPQTGQVWAVYKEWNVEWKISDIKKCAEKGKYEVVEVLSSLSSKFQVLLLDRADGSKDLFQPRNVNGVSITMTIPREEHLRFSHQIPCSRLNLESGGKLCSYWDLDAESLPDADVDKNSS